jgi:hypothetical protein
MKRYLLKAVFLVLMVCSLASAAELMAPARQIGVHHGSVTLYGGKANNTLNLRSTGSSSVNVGAFSYQSTGAQDIEVPVTASQMTVQLLLNPDAALSYWFRCGVVAYELQLPSTTVKNTAWGYSPGIRCGVGARKLLFPDTLFSPAIAFSIGIMYERQELDTLRNEQMAKQVIRSFVEITEYQLTCSVSKRFSHVEPYGALRIERTCMALIDSAYNSELRGIKDAANITAGCCIKIFDNEEIVVEASLGNQTGMTAGWKVTF